MEQDKKIQETITKYLGDMHALQTHGLDAVSQQVGQLKDKGHPDAFRFVQDAKSVLEAHVGFLEARMKELGGSPTNPIKAAVAGAAGVAAGAYNAVRNEQASKSVRDDYTFLSNSAIAYLMLHTTARGFGDLETARLAETGYRDMARLIMDIDRIMPSLVVEEFEQDKLPIRDVSAECRELVHSAWNRQSASFGTTSDVDRFAQA